MSIAILSIPLGIIAIIGIIWSINAMSEEPAKGKDKSKKKDNDAALIGIIVSLVLFFVALGIFDSEESTAGLLPSETAEEQSYQRDSEPKSQAQREVEEANREAMEKAAKKSQDDSGSNSNDKNNSSDSQNSNSKDFSETTKIREGSQNKNLEKQQKAYEAWHNQIEAKVQSIETTWSALWTENSAESLEKLQNVLLTAKTQLEEIKIPDELSAAHKQKLETAVKRYEQWIDTHIKACQMKSAKNNEQDINNEIARGEGLKMQSNVEISNVGRELGLSER